jgi:hypothetical protein
MVLVTIVAIGTAPPRTATGSALMRNITGSPPAESPIESLIRTPRIEITKGERDADPLPAHP